MLDDEVKTLLDRIRDSLELPVRYLFARMPGDIAPVRRWMPPRPGSYERRRVREFKDLGFVVRIWSPPPEPNF